MTHLRQLPTLTLAAAKAIAAAAEAFARERGWTVAIAVVDAAGGLILFQILDDTQPGSQEVAVHKARTAARFKRPTKALEETVAGGRQALLSLPGVTAVPDGATVDEEGGIWIAACYGSELRRYTSDGALDDRLPLPVASPTAVAFGESDGTAIVLDAPSRHVLPPSPLPLNTLMPEAAALCRIASMLCTSASEV